jgi:N6-adenosine-specific RNA methylase IME4
MTEFKKKFDEIIDSGKKYQLIIADPPYSYHLWKVTINTPPSKRRVRMASAYYDTMTTDDICKLEVNKITDKNCALLLWVTSPLLPDGLKIMESWGFNYKTIGINWIKKTKHWKDKLGLGNYFRPSSEIALLGIKGRLDIKDHSVRQVYIDNSIAISNYPTIIYFHQIMEHSTKPKIHHICEMLFGQVPSIELFARDSSIENWDYWGNEL